MSDEYALCRMCYKPMKAILDRRLRDYCQSCSEMMKVDPGIRFIPFREVKDEAPEVDGND